MLVIGESGCGKTSLVLKYCDGKFNEELVSTIGVDFKVKYLKRRDKTICIQLWDSAGQERYRTVSYHVTPALTFSIRSLPHTIVEFQL